MDHKEYCRAYYQENKERHKKKAQENRERIAKLVEEGKVSKPDIKEKECIKCKKLLLIQNFSFRKARNIYESKCKSCRAIEAKNYRENNREKVLENNRKSHKFRMENDKQYSILHTLRSRMNKIIDRKYKPNSNFTLIGSTKEQLVQWIDFNLQFESDMTWKNRGSIWHIDHVIPCNTFDLTKEENQKICMNWSNLKPMFASKNISKQDNILLMQCIENELRLFLFKKQFNIEIDNFLFKWRK